MQANLMLLLAAAIWGLGFVAQRLGMDYLEPYAFNALRFLIGALSLLPLIYWYKNTGRLGAYDKKALLWAALPVGAVLFIAASLQQVGLLYTSAANAGFITGLYMVLVPVLGLLLGQRTSANTWLGAGIAISGLYLLSVGDNFTVNLGDLLQLIGALFWAAHLLCIDHYTKKVPPILLACLQFVVCGLLSAIVALSIETPTPAQAVAAWQPLLFSGVVSVGIAYTLQVLAQKHAHPAHAAIILSLETVFAAIGGVLLLGEELGGRALLGCGLMLLGMLASQLPLRWLLRSKAFH
ncbi:DMT family transporter [Rheinheimera sp.]|uniref:DMT family transporter n=1 Tax=Rheinheimera sp. TaxID=1869214 RepID=UPI00307D0274